MRTRLVGFVLTLLAFTFYVFGASATLDGGDSGEFIAASCSLGVSHSPGYPLIALLLKAFQILLPVGSVAYRCHVFSALTVCSLLVALFLLLREQKSAAVFSILFVAFSPLVIEQARVAEVFLLNALFVVGIALGLRSNQLPLASFLFGLALGNHHTVVVVVPFFVMAAWYFRIGKREFAVCWLALVLGLTIYLLLPIRAHATPPVNFGVPDTWPRFWAVITRKEFGTLSLHPAALAFRDISTSIQHVEVFFDRTLKIVGIPGLIVCVVGAIVGLLQRRRRSVTSAILITFMALGIGFDIVANLSPFSDIGQWRLERFFILPLLALSGLAFVAFASVSEIPSRGLRIGLCGVLLLTLAPPLRAGFGTPSFRWNMAFRDFAISALRSAPQDCRLVIDRVLFDEPTSALLVTTIVENKRPDVRFYYRPGTLFEPVYGRDVLELTWPQRYERQVQVEKTLSDSTEPVRCLAFDRRSTPFPSATLSGLLYADRPSDQDDGLILMPRGLGEPSAEYSTRLISVHTPYLIGKMRLENGDVESAHQWFGRALRTGPDMAWLHSNIGGLYAQTGHYSEARRLFDQSVALDPYFFEGLFGIGFSEMHGGNNAAAIPYFERAVRVGPNRADGWYMLGVACYEAGDNPCVQRAWGRYLDLESNGAMAEVVRKKLQGR